MSVFKGAASQWNTESGSTGLFVGVALVPEYLCLLTLIAVGLVIGRVKIDSEKERDCHFTKGWY